MQALEEHFSAVMADLLKEAGGRLWRNRQASCAAIADLLTGRRHDWPYLIVLYCILETPTQLLDVWWCVLKRVVLFAWAEATTGQLDTVLAFVLAALHLSEC